MLARHGPIRVLTMEVSEQFSSRLLWHGTLLAIWKHKQVTVNALPEADFHLVGEGQHSDVNKDGLPAHLNILSPHDRNK